MRIYQPEESVFLRSKIYLSSIKVSRWAQCVTALPSAGKRERYLGVLLPSPFVGWCWWHSKNCNATWTENGRQELDLCNLKKFRLAAAQSNLNPERSGWVLLFPVFSFDGSRGSTTSSVEVVGFAQYFFLLLIYPSENGDFNTFSERNSHKYFPLPGQMLQLCFCKRGMGYSDSYN